MTVCERTRNIIIIIFTIAVITTRVYYILGKVSRYTSVVYADVYWNDDNNYRSASSNYWGQAQRFKKKKKTAIEEKPSNAVIALRTGLRRNEYTIRTVSPQKCIIIFIFFFSCFRKK